MGPLSRVDWNETLWCSVMFLGNLRRWVEIVTCSALHWCRNPGNESYDGLGSLVAPCYGMSVRYFPSLACGTRFLSSFASLEDGGLKCTRSGTCGDQPDWEALPLCLEFTVSTAYLLGFGLWGIVSWCTYMNTLSTHVSYHLTCLSALDLLFGAGWTVLHVIGVSLFCEAGKCCVSWLANGTPQLWWPWFPCLDAAWEVFEFINIVLLTLTVCMFNVWTLVAMGSGMGSVFFFYGA